MISESINNAQNRIKKNFDDKDFLELFQKGGVAMLFRIGGQILGFILTFVIAYFFGANCSCARMEHSWLEVMRGRFCYH